MPTRNPAELCATIAAFVSTIDAAPNPAAARAALGGFVMPEATRRADGVLVHQFPYATYAASVDRMWEAAGALGWLKGYDYVEWLTATPEDRRSPAAIGGMDRADAERALVSIWRAERFCEGAWASAIESGHLRAALARMLDLTPA